MSESKLHTFPVIALAAATCGTAFATAGFALSGGVATQTIVGWFCLFIGAHLFATLFHPEESDAWNWLLARWIGWGCLVGYCFLANTVDVPLEVSLAVLLVWKWVDIVFTYKVVDAD
jgi:hypothetical protein